MMLLEVVDASSGAGIYSASEAVIVMSRDHMVLADRVPIDAACSVTL